MVTGTEADEDLVAPRPDAVVRRPPGEAKTFPPRRVRQGEDMLLPRPMVLLVALALLVRAAATVHANDDARDSLWAAVRNGDAQAAKALLDKGADVNATNEIGVSAL